MKVRAAAVAWLVCCVAGIGVGELVEAATTTCSIAAATVSNYAESAYAAAVVEYADCTTAVVRVVADSSGITQLDLSSKRIVYVESLPPVVTLYVLALNCSVRDVGLMNGVAALVVLHISFPDPVTTLNLSGNPITYISGVVFPSSLEVLIITSTVKLQEFEVRQTDATLFAGLQTFNVSVTTSLSCSDSSALYRYVQNTLLCVLSDEAFNLKYGISSAGSGSGSTAAIAATSAPIFPEAHSARRSKYLLFAAVSLSLACVGLLSTLAPRTLYERYQRKKYLKLRMKMQHHQQQQPPPPVTTPTALSDAPPAYWDL
ncbi:unnamed protein product [Phytophthora fragariaefolia]|uniref:Unnamed protein product n=1 Tax=Phytophthora fragariaefolia TaxID=1490495 RepID=A0A9W6Y2Y3_9STRA|nr:unnamed protein product [Phytophthora fragariaefolia]